MEELPSLKGTKESHRVDKRESMDEVSYGRKKLVEETEYEGKREVNEELDKLTCWVNYLKIEEEKNEEEEEEDQFDQRNFRGENLPKSIGDDDDGYIISDDDFSQDYDQDSIEVPNTFTFYTSKTIRSTGVQIKEIGHKEEEEKVEEEGEGKVNQWNFQGKYQTTFLCEEQLCKLEEGSSTDHLYIILPYDIPVPKKNTCVEIKEIEKEDEEKEKEEDEGEEKKKKNKKKKNKKKNNKNKRKKKK